MRSHAKIANPGTSAGPTTNPKRTTHISDGSDFRLWRPGFFSRPFLFCSCYRRESSRDGHGRAKIDQVPIQTSHSAQRKGAGDAAEQLVADYLVSQGAKILYRNLRLNYLELDIVALYLRTVLVVEVRYRSEAAQTTGFSSVGAVKRRRLRYAGERLWNRYFKHRRDVDRLRFDVASVTQTAEGPRIEYAVAAL